MNKVIYKRLSKVLKANRKLVLYRHENGLPQVRECDQERREKLMAEAGALLEAAERPGDVDPEEVDYLLYYAFRNCPPGDLLLMNETMYGDGLEELLESSESDLCELGLELLSRLCGIMEIQHGAHACGMREAC